jgi:hypothetical protein
MLEQFITIHSGEQHNTREAAVIDRPYLNTREAAQRVGLAPGTLQNLRVSGGGPRYLRIGRLRIFYEVSALDEWARSNEFRSTAEYKIAA